MPTRQELEAQYRKEESRQRTVAILRRAAIWAGVVVGLFAMVFGLAKLGSQNTAPIDATIQDPINATDWIKGSQMAQATLIEYGDFQCPGCASVVPFIKSLEKNYGTKLKIIFRHYPLRMIHSNAQLSAQAAEAAGKQGKFWEMHDLLFANQNAWSSQKNPQSVFEGYAAQLGLNVEQFRTDLTSEVVKQKIDNDLATGNRASVQSTPSFYLNGKYVNYSTYDEFEQLVKQTVGQ